MPVCALCKQERELCESHVYPKFTYKRMKEEDGRMHQFSTASGGKSRVVQDGFKERLLCKGCEALFQCGEDYFARALNQKQMFDLPRPRDGKKWIRIEGFDYQKARLFLLSVLWRTHASRHPRFGIQLGEKHSTRLRAMLLQGEPGEPEEYGAVVAVPYVEFNDDEPVQLRPATTVTPDNVRWEHGLRIVRMQIDGLLLQFVVGALHVVKRHSVRHLFLQRDGTLVVGIEDLTNIWYLINSWGRALGFL